MRKIKFSNLFWLFFWLFVLAGAAQCFASFWGVCTLAAVVLGALSLILLAIFATTFWALALRHRYKKWLNKPAEDEAEETS